MKIKTKIEIKDDLKRELKDFAKQVCVGAAAYTRDALTDAAYEVFERFYCSYTPRDGSINTTYEWKFYTPDGVPFSYHRTYNILLNGINKFYENKHGKIIRGGVELSPESMKDLYNIPTIDVFNHIIEGYHGLPSQGLPIMKPSPNEIINNKQQELINNLGSCSDAGINRAKKRNYAYLQW